MQDRNFLSLNAVQWWYYFEKDYYHYDGIGKRLSDLVKFGLAERRWNDEKGYMLYQVSDKWLCINSMEEYAQAVYKQPRTKKTREESAVKKECKDKTIAIWKWRDMSRDYLDHSVVWRKWTEEEYKAKEIREQDEREKLHRTLRTKLNEMIWRTDTIRWSDKFIPTIWANAWCNFTLPCDPIGHIEDYMVKKPRYKRLRSVFKRA